MEHLNKPTLAKLYNTMSPFEFKEKLIALANSNKAPETKLLDAGRGNPNWIAPEAREAFFSFGQFALLESKRHWDQGYLSGMPKREGIAKRFNDYLAENSSIPGHALLKEIAVFGYEIDNTSEDEWIHALVDGIIGDNYPYPDRMLIPIEKVVSKYLVHELCNDKLDSTAFDIFATEGGSAGMCYLFDSLLQNHILQKGDKIALMTPIFTPYLEIPELPQYDFDLTLVKADVVDEHGVSTWQYSENELGKLKDKSIKAVFVVNPNNPGSIALSDDSRNLLVELVKNDRPDLLVITDDVYSTFVEDFSSLLIDLPYNTLCVYSLSKYFGVTGWRLGTIMLHKENVFDWHIANLPDALREHANGRYHHITSTPETLGFIDRIVADSRQVALNHTAGLSTPQQIQMAFFCIYALTDRENKYKKQAIALCQTRKQALCKGLDKPFEVSTLDASYYTEVNVMEWARAYDENFAAYLEANYTLFDFLYTLAEKHYVILLRGDAFASSKWGLRVSLANQFEEDYYKIGAAIRTVFDEVVSEWESKYLHRG